MGGHSGNSELEVLKLNSWSWETKAAYPLTNGIFGYASVYFHDKLYIFSGIFSRAPFETDLIFSYTPETNKWLPVGNLNTGFRYYHNAIVTNDYILVAGGSLPNERCAVIGKAIECVKIGPYVGSFPQLFNVERDYCR